ncbi:hypothetical protein B0A52_01123 [Exophiala mesophila]|uniref:Cupin type-1 domain-containing protein n=1 Tax=Exophiala mesophila TaxID=212818 RepID=A0A438NGL4_EXOME|nr:hypothetical protein B0A52_01123 [Exophiala mesophila]
MLKTCLWPTVLVTTSLGMAIQRSFDDGVPYDPATGKGAIISGGTNHEIDLQNPSGLGQESTDAGSVPNLKWSFSMSKTKIFPGGWVRQQVIDDLPQSHDIAAAQQHLKKGAIRELHWHTVAEWGFVYEGEVLITAMDENGKYQIEKLGFGDVWYFPKGSPHSIQGLAEENECLLAFDSGDFDKRGVTFNVADWVAHTPKAIIAKNFGVNESVLNDLPQKNPYILNSTTETTTSIQGPVGELTGNASYVYRTLQHDPESIGGNGGTIYKIDSSNFPTAKTIAASFVTLKPGGLREMNWHPNAEQWLYFHRGQGRATAYIGNSNARTFDFVAGDVGVFPDSSGQYIENTSETEDLVWIELYKSDRVADVPLTQWLALTPPEIVASILKLPLEVIHNLKKEKQVLIE